MTASVNDVIPPVRELEARIQFLQRELYTSKRLLPLAKVAEECRQINAGLTDSITRLTPYEGAGHATG